MAAISFSAALEVAQDPSQWTCQSCGSSNECWICLTDGAVVCNDHAPEHADTVTPPFFIEIAAPQGVKNFVTGSTIKLGARKSDDAYTVSAIAAIRGRLQNLQTLGGTKWQMAKGWNKIRLAVKLFGVPFLTRAAQLERRRKDAQATALRRWLDFDVWKAFRSWKLAVKANTFESTSSSSGALPAGKRPRSAIEEDPLMDLPDAAKPAAPKSKLEQQARQGRTGLRNLGNTCYCNSTTQALAHIPLLRAYLFALKAPTYRRVVDMISSLTLGVDIAPMPPLGSSHTATARAAGESGESKSGSPSASPPMPAASPRLLRLNSGLADLLEFGPTLSGLRGGSGGGAGLATSPTPLASPPTAAAVGSRGDANDGSRRTRAKRDDSLTSPAARLHARQLTSSFHEVASRIFGFEPMAVYTPDAFLKTMWVNLPQFSGFNQQDAEEYCRAFLNRLDEEAVAAERNASDGVSGGGSSSTGASGALEEGGKGVENTPRLPSAVHQLVGGTAVTRITCSVCHTISVREEPFMGPFNVEVPEKLRTTVAPSARNRGAPSVALTTCLAHAFQSETLDGECAYACDTCKKKVAATLSRGFAIIPPVLILNVVRTSWTGNGAKIQTMVDLPPDTIDLSQWCDVSTTTGTGIAGSSMSAQVAHQYELLAIVQHIGSGIKQGHYIAFARNNTKDDWYCFNDARVTPASDVEMAGVQGYMYYFQRKLC